jgi:hypothetical protein
MWLRLTEKVTIWELFSTSSNMEEKKGEKDIDKLSMDS